MTGRAGAHVFVRGVLEVSSGVADSRRCDTLDLAKYGFHSPETAGCKRRLLHVVPLQSFGRCTSGGGRVRRTSLPAPSFVSPLFDPCEFSPAIIFRILGYPPRKDQS